ncbi:hypothetical protein G9403_03060 [Weissella paramesenteroides]|uniref:DNA-directed DNA polymerase family A palm domain-containing protein n=1 Tax=Weissella paramesenteroides TaxID=1249 RepID=A0ABD4XH70_WEIPA|nr:DNA polymerase [Weissella paramesenteroides]MDF8368586.1 hypothetical protein [Weissella paramesenteroides]MDF8370642.1 hypothetical protein [Weissella paramesenteroides]
MVEKFYGKDDQFDKYILPQLNSTGFTISYFQILLDCNSGKLVVDDLAELRRWSTGLLNIQGRTINEVDGTVHIIGKHEAYANIPMQMSTRAPNTQSIPKWCRNYLVAPTGRRFVALDIGSAEPRALAGVANDETLRMAISEGLYESVGNSLLEHTGIIIPRKLVKSLCMGFLYGQSSQGVGNTLSEMRLTNELTREVFLALQDFFQKSTSLLSQVSKMPVAYLQGRPSKIDVSDKRPNQRRSYLASSIIAALVKRWATRLIELNPEIWIHEIPRDALWLSIPESETDETVLNQGILALKQAINDCKFQFPIDEHVMTIKNFGGQV